MIFLEGASVLFFPSNTAESAAGDPIVPHRSYVLHIAKMVYAVFAAQLHCNMLQHNLPSQSVNHETTDVA